MSVVIDGTAGISSPSANISGALTANTEVFGYSPVVTTPTAGMVLSTTVATTSGTAFLFSGIPSWVKKISIMLNGTTTNGSGAQYISIGSGSLTTSGYTGGMWYSSGGAVNSNAFLIGAQTSGQTKFGNIFLIHMGNNVWNISGAGYTGGPGLPWVMGGNLALSGVLDRINLSNTGSPDTFTGGSVNILYEG